MDNRSKTLFLLLVLTQVAHSVEEYVMRLFDVFAPARFVSGLVATDLQTGFALLNTGIVCFGLWCYFFPVARGWSVARGVAWWWIAVESVNGVVHLLVALVNGGYFPGAATALPLLGFSIALAVRLRQSIAVAD